MKITRILHEKPFTVSVELVPPRNGADPERFLAMVGTLASKIDFVSVTKGAGGSLRGGTLPFSFLVRDRFGIEPIAHFVCRERTAAEIENDLMDLHLLGIANVLALRGDAPAGAKDEAWDGDYRYAWQLVEQISRLNRGKYLPRKGFETEARDGVPTDFCILVAGHPEDPIEGEIAHLRAKIEAGAQAVMTQMVFSFEEYRRYVEALRAAGITVPVLAGVRPLMTRREMEAVESFFGMTVDPGLKEGILAAGSDEAVRRFCLDYFHDMIARLRAYGAPGAHLFVLNNVGLVDELGLAWQPTLV